MAKTFLDFEGLTTYNDKIRDSYLSRNNMELDFAEYVKTNDLLNTLGNYATEESVSDMLTKTEANSTYAKETEISDMLTKTEASSTYVNNDKLTSQLASQKDELEQEINSKISTVYKPQGSTSFEALTRPPTQDMLGYVYNITGQFTTDGYFVEGVGHNHTAGTNVVVVNDTGIYKYDVLSGMVDASWSVEVEPIPTEQIESLFN